MEKQKLTREQEIDLAAYSWGAAHAKFEIYQSDPGFVAGAEWADEHPKSQWVKVSERLPKKIDGRIRSNPVLVVNQYGDWSIAEYNFDKKEWIDILNDMNDLLEPVYWQEVIIPKELQ